MNTNTPSRLNHNTDLRMGLRTENVLWKNLRTCHSCAWTSHHGGTWVDWFVIYQQPDTCILRSVKYKDDLQMMNWKGRGRKRYLHNLRCYQSKKTKNWYETRISIYEAGLIKLDIFLTHRQWMLTNGQFHASATLFLPSVCIGFEARTSNSFLPSRYIQKSSRKLCIFWTNQPSSAALHKHVGKKWVWWTVLFHLQVLQKRKKM